MTDTPATLLHDEPMARHTTWRVGGPAERWFEPLAREALLGFLRALDPATPLTWVGLGSNLLVRDGGLRGVVICTSRALGALHHDGSGMVMAGAGVACTTLARRCREWQLGPAAFFAGIPGTVGGALAMNAGAFGGETWSRVVEVEVVDRHGTVRTRPAAAYQPGYRELRGPADEWFLGARLRFDTGHADAGEVRALMAERRARQPLGLPSCGSVFRNPPGDHAARLIEAAGLKGARIGGAQVSPQHANFIINTGGASAADIEGLIRHVQEAVARHSGVHLETEVRIVGEPAARETAQ